MISLRTIGTLAKTGEEIQLKSSISLKLRQNSLLQSPLKELLSSPGGVSGAHSHMMPSWPVGSIGEASKSPTSNMMTMKRPTKQPSEEHPYRGGGLTHLSKVPKQSQKVIDFDNMSSFESEAGGRSKARSCLGQEEPGREAQQALLNKKFELMKRHNRGVDRSNESAGPGSPTTTGKFAREY